MKRTLTELAGAIPVAAVLALGAGSLVAKTNYVALTGSHTPPFDSWSTAATNLQSAVAAASDGDVVLVAAGYYPLYSTVSLTNGIVVRSASGPRQTIVDGRNNYRCFYLRHANALVEGFSVVNGFVSQGTMPGGGGVWIDGQGTLRGCIVSGCFADYQGGGVYCSGGGLIESCLVCSNRADYVGGGVSLSTNGALVNATVVRNRTDSGGYGGGVAFGQGGSATNSIISLNSASAGTDYYAEPSSKVRFVACCSPGLTNNGCLGADPQFVNATAGDFHLQSTSPCIDIGRTSLAMFAAQDAEAQPRVRNGIVDLGTFEYHSETFRCNILAFPDEGLSPLTSILIAGVDGTNTSITNYVWDLDNDGSVEFRGPGWTQITNTYPEGGNFTVALMVQNAAGQTASVVRSNGVIVHPSVVYVSPRGGHAPPFGNWINAATNLANALAEAVDGAAVLVSNGTYRVSTHLIVTNGVTIRSVNGPWLTTVDGNYPTTSNRCFFLSHPNAVVDGFTLMNGWADRYNTGVPWPRYDGAAVLIATNGTLLNCILRNNTSRGNGGGVSLVGGGMIRNCLVVNNYANDKGGGVYLVNGGTVQNCTVVSNRWVGISRKSSSSGLVENSIVFFNTGGNYDTSLSSGLFTYSCTTPVIAGTGNLSDDPQLVAPAGLDFHLKTNSPCLNKGTNQPWMSGGTDLDGNARLVGGTTDLGAYEFGPLVCTFVASTNQGKVSVAVQFTANISGSSQTGITYGWDFNNDGTVEEQGPGLRQATNTFGIGTHSVRLRVTNQAGEVAVFLRENCVTVTGYQTNYVSPSGGHTSPFTSWATAATNLQAAVDAAQDDDTVLVGDGYYPVTTPVRVSRRINLVSLHGAAATIVDGQRLGRGFHLLAPAVIHGFTITNGLAQGSASPQFCGGGVLLEQGGVVENCIIVNNEADQYGGGLYFGAGGSARNCLITGNRSRVGGGSSGGTLQNCTIIGNTATLDAGGAYSATCQNCILYYNTVGGVTMNYSSLSACTYTCTLPLPAGTGNFTSQPGLAAVNNPHLVTTSPCINAGNNASAPGSTDLFGNVRIQGTKVDLGCEELTPSTKTGPLSVSLSAPWTNAVVNHPLTFAAGVQGNPAGFFWQFGDGQTASDVLETSHAFGTPGSFPVTLTAWNNTHTNSASLLIQISAGFTNYVSLSGGHIAPFTNWATAARDLQSAVDAVPIAGGTVRVADGTYVSGSRLMGGTSNRVCIDKPITVAATNPNPSATVIRGFANNVSGVRCVYLGDHARLLGVTLASGGTAYSDGAGGRGAGAFCRDQAYLSNCIIRDCRGHSSGAGASADVACLATIENSEIRNNQTDNDGGGLAGMVARSCIISSNVAQGYGGGVVRGWTVNSTITNNTCQKGGGGGYYANVQSCVVASNSAALEGGGLHYSYGSDDYYVESSLITGNRSSLQGGGLYVIGSDLNVSRCTFQGNTAVLDGGGICALDGSFVSCLISGNTAQRNGGGVFLNGLLSMTNCTVVGNDAVAGGGAYCASSPKLVNTILYYNTPGGNYTNTGSSVNYQCCCTVPAVSGTGNFTNEPAFVSRDTGNYHLASGSPCINAGTNQTWMTAATDLDGRPRILDIRVDLGAYELAANANDSDEDGLPDAWEFSFFSTLATMTATSDSDYDGATDLHEYWAGTNPTNAASAFRLLAPASPASGPGLTIRWSSESNKHYTLLRSTNLAQPFAPLLPTNLAATPPTNGFTDPQATGRGPYFYRVRLDP